MLSLGSGKGKETQPAGNPKVWLPILIEGWNFYQCKALVPTEKYIFGPQFKLFVSLNNRLGPSNRNKTWKLKREKNRWWRHFTQKFVLETIFVIAQMACEFAWICEYLHKLPVAQTFKVMQSKIC